MKKRVLALLCVSVLAMTLFAACSSAVDEAPGFTGVDEDFNRAMFGGGGGYAYDDVMVEEAVSMPAPESAPAMPMPEADMGWDGAGASYNDASIGSESITPLSAQKFSEKIIYSHYAFIETLNFDETLEKVDAMIAAHGGFIENSSIQGSNYEAYYYGWPSRRSAHYTIRVPVDQLGVVTGKLDTLGNVVNHTSNADNITSQFIDTESRLNSLRIQEERLLDMLKKAEDVPDLITIETSLSEVRYQIEQLTTTLMQWQQQVDYSTLTLNISEVEEFQESVPINLTYWERMRNGIIRTLRNVGRFFTELFMWLVVNIPVLIILAIVGTAAYFIIRSKVRKSNEKARARVMAKAEEKREENREENYN